MEETTEPTPHRYGIKIEFTTDKILTTEQFLSLTNMIEGYLEEDGFTGDPVGYEASVPVIETVFLYSAGYEFCELCREEVTYCACWRCMVCEELYPDGTDWHSDLDRPDQHCDKCWASLETSAEGTV